MRLENQVCTLEQAKKLKALGIEQKATFYYYNNELNLLRTYSDHGYLVVNSVAAFTVAELGLILPDQFSSWKYQSSDGERWDCAAEENRYYSHLIEYCKTEAEARAAMLIYLLENDHITSETVNSLLLQY